MANKDDEDNSVIVPRTDDDDKLNKRLDSLKSEAGRYREQFEKEWKEYEKFYNNQHWRFTKKRSHKNWVFTTIESEVPILTDSRPSVDILPLQQDQTEEAKVLESGVHSVLEAERLILKQTSSVRSSLITGTGWLYVDYDPDKERGDGSPIIRNVGWRHIWMDPKATEIDEADYGIIEFPESVAELRRRFPKQADKIQPTSSANLQAFGNQRPDGTKEDKWSPEIVSEQPRGRFESPDIASLEEFWVRDYSTETIPEEITVEEISHEREQLLDGINPDVFKYEDHDPHIVAHSLQKAELASQLLGVSTEELNDEMLEALEDSEEVGVLFKIIDDHIDAHQALKIQNPDGKRPKYTDNLRLILRVGKEILFDGSHPEGDGKIPLVPIYCYKTEDSIYGTGEVKNILNAQKSYNELDWAELQGLRLTTNTGWVVDEESGVDTDTLTNEPGIVVKKKQGTEARRLEPGLISSQLGLRQEADKFAIEGISGINEATQGRRPTGITAASAIKFLQEQSVGRIRLKTRYLEEYSMPRLGELIAARIVNHWTVEKKLRVYDRNGQLKYIEFDPERVQKLKYDVRMVPGSTAGLDKESIFAVMKELALGGFIDPKTFIETTDVPFKATILERMQENDEKAQLIEQLTLQNEELQAQIEEVLGVAEGTEQPQAPQAL